MSDPHSVTAPPVKKRPFLTVVSGLPRSGTSVMMQMLAAGGLPALTDGLRTPDPDNPRGYYEFEAVKATKRDSAWVHGAAGSVVKMVHLLLEDLPAQQQYRVVMMRRDLGEVLASQKKMLERSGRAGGGLDDAKLKTLFDNQMARVIASVRSKPNFELMEVNYADVIADPKRVAGALSAFLDGGLDEGAMVSAVDPSLYRNRA